MHYPCLYWLYIPYNIYFPHNIITLSFFFKKLYAMILPQTSTISSILAMIITIALRKRKNSFLKALNFASLSGVSLRYKFFSSSPSYKWKLASQTTLSRRLALESKPKIQKLAEIKKINQVTPYKQKYINCFKCFLVY